MSNKSITALIVLFFAALMVLWFADAQLAWRVPTSTRSGPLLEGLAGLRPDDLQAIEIERGTERIVFQRRDERTWQMTSPVDAAADPALVENLALRLKGLTRLPAADSLKGDPAEYGLAPAASVVRLWGRSAGAPLAQLELGKALPDRRYVRIGARGAVEVVPAQGLEVVDLPVRRWRDREAFRVSPIEVDDVAVSSGESTLRLVRSIDAWRVAEPVRFRAETRRVEELVGSLAALRITDDRQFVADGVATDAEADRYGLLHPSLTVTLRSGRGPYRRADQTLRVGRAVPDQVDRVYARRGDQGEVLALDARIVDRLRTLKPNALRSEKVADIDPNRALRLRISQGERSFDLVRSGRAWTLAAPLSGLADPKTVQEYFKALEGLRTPLYLPDDDSTQRLAGTRQPRFTVQVWQAPDPRGGPAPAPHSASGPTGSPPADPADPARPADFAIRFGNWSATQNVQYAQVEGDTSILVLNQRADGSLNKGSWAFRDRLVLQVATALIDRIRVEGARPSVTLQPPVLRVKLSENAPVGWWLTAPVAAPADRDAVTRLLKLLASLQADGFAAEAPESLSPFGLDNPVLRLTWSIPDEAPPVPRLLAPPRIDPATGRVRSEERSLLVGGAVPDRPTNRYAMIAGESVVFILGPVALATLDAEWHDRAVARFDPRAVDRIALQYSGTWFRFSFVRGERGWVPADPDGLLAEEVLPPGFAVESVGPALAAASRLTTPRFAQYAGEAPASVGLAPPYLRVRFEGKDLASPVALDFGRPLDGRLVYAMAPDRLPGAVFLLEYAPFLAWLNADVRPIELPENVFAPEDPPAVPTPPGPPAAAPGTGQAAGQPR